MATPVSVPARRAASVLLSGLLTAGLLAGCGKKGPPLAPEIKTPGRVTDLSARRLGDTVFVRFTVPAANQDGSQPVDLEAVEIYAYTAMRAAEGRDLKSATLLATVPVRQPISPDDEERWKKAGAPPPPNPGEAPGAVVVVTETITPDLLVPLRPAGGRGTRAEPSVPEPGPEAESGAESGALALPLTGPVVPRLPSRFYMAYGMSRRGLRGPVSTRPGVPLAVPPAAPPAPAAEVSEKAVTVTWPAPASQRKPVQEPAAGDVLKSTPRGQLPRTAVTFNVYLASPGDAAPTQPAPLNEKPLEGLSFADTAYVVGTPRCYVVRAVEGSGAASIESPPSPATCVTPVDTFPPPAPGSLAAVASEGAISLIWEAVEAADLAGYLVLRAESGGAPLQPLFDVPIRETTYRDATARAGVRYTYAVVSVDTAVPRNVSAPSNRVDESAR
jgi:hypothetical protein